jgi:hypothetical protein
MYLYLNNKSFTRVKHNNIRSKRRVEIAMYALDTKLYSPGDFLNDIIVLNKTGNVCINEVFRCVCEIIVDAEKQ